MKKKDIKRNFYITEILKATVCYKEKDLNRASTRELRGIYNWLKKIS